MHRYQTVLTVVCQDQTYNKLKISKIAVHITQDYTKKDKNS